MISLCSVISGADDFEEIAEYGRQKEDFLRCLLILPNGIPSHDTFNRVFRLMNSRSFEACLKKWSHEIIDKRKDYQLTFMDELHKWPDCQSVIMVECERSFKNDPEKTQFKTRFYISSKLESATYFGVCTRNHWSIENQLHLYLDVIFAEDRQRSRKDHAPENMKTLRKIALQLLLHNKGKDSLKKIRKRAAWNDQFLVEVLNTIPT